MTSGPAVFTSESIQFLKALDGNNTREWFEANKAVYQSHLKAPADALKAELVEGLGQFAEMPMTGKIFRINRDLRFSKDKTPYNTHVRMAFWPAAETFQGKDAQPPSFFLSIEADRVHLGAGCMAFSKPVLGTYLRKLEMGGGKELEELLKSLSDDGFRISDPDLARPPRGFPKDHPSAPLSRHKGLAAWNDLNGTEAIVGSLSARSLISSLKPTLSLWNWLKELHGAA